MDRKRRGSTTAMQSHQFWGEIPIVLHIVLHTVECRSSYILPKLAHIPWPFVFFLFFSHCEVIGNESQKSDDARALTELHLLESLPS